MYFDCKRDRITDKQTDGRTDRQTDRCTDDPITRCPRRTFQAVGIKICTAKIISLNCFGIPNIFACEKFPLYGYWFLSHKLQCSLTRWIFSFLWENKDSETYKHFVSVIVTCLLLIHLHFSLSASYNFLIVIAGVIIIILLIFYVMATYGI